MDFKTGSLMYLLGIGTAVFVLGQAMFFIVHSYRKGKNAGLKPDFLKRTIISSAVFSILPSLGVVATVLVLVNSMGIVLPWIRLTFTGSIQDNVMAAESAVSAAGGTLSSNITNAQTFSTVAWVMTTAGIMALIVYPFVLKIYGKKLSPDGEKEKSRLDIFIGILGDAMYIGIVAAFFAKAIAGQGRKEVIGDGAGVLSLFALLSSSLLAFFLMRVCKRRSLNRLQSYVLPLSMICAMIMTGIIAYILPDKIAFFEWRG